MSQIVEVDVLPAAVDATMAWSIVFSTLETIRALQFGNLIERIPQPISKLFEILLVKEQLVLAVRDFSRSMGLAFAFGNREIQVLGPCCTNIKEVRALSGLYSNGVYVFLASVIPSPVRLVAIAFHVSDLMWNKVSRIQYGLT